MSKRIQVVATNHVAAFNVGDKVEHDLHGRGTVVYVMRVNCDPWVEYTVRFRGLGTVLAYPDQLWAVQR